MFPCAVVKNLVETLPTVNCRYTSGLIRNANHTYSRTFRNDSDSEMVTSQSSDRCNECRTARILLSCRFLMRNERKNLLQFSTAIVQFSEAANLIGL
jgi:hypothetical protein